MNDSGRPRSDRWWDEDLAGSDDPIVGAVALAVLGAGLGSLFGLPVLAAIDFWIIFAIGYAVVVPLVSLLRGRTAGTDPARRGSPNAAQSERADAARSGTDDVDEALARLHAPVGIEVGGGDPEDVALSILAQLNRVRTGLPPTLDG